MKISNQKYFLLLAASLLMVGCDPNITSDEEVVAVEPGTADFSSFVAIGDSLTAGIADGALYRDGQLNSYPAILAQQFALVGGGDFSQPLMPEGATGSLTLLGTPIPGIGDRRVLIGTDNPTSPLAPVAITPTQPTSINVPLTGPFKNMGVASAKSFHLLANTYGDPGALPAANPFYIRFASSTGATMIGDAAVQAPSFFVLWIGNNDVLSYATGGGTGDEMAGLDPTAYGSEDITNTTVFAGTYAGLLGAINTPTNKGVLANIGAITSIPFFTFVDYNPIPMDAATADATNAAYADYNGALLLVEGTQIMAEERAQRTISFAASEANPIVIEDDSLTTIMVPNPGPGPALVPLPSIRQATAEDFILLTTGPKIGTLADPDDPTSVNGVGVALADEDVLTKTEAALVETARTAYNATIKAAADADPNLLLFDVSTLFAEIKENGASYGTGAAFTDYITGGFFSLDGIHPTARGYAVTANEIIKVINAGFGATIPLVDPGEYTTVFYQ